MAGGLEGFSDSVALIPQDPEIFTTTIRENVAMGTSLSDEALVPFTDLACFSSVVKRLPKGLSSAIKEKGVNLSGGEKQRLALSRGLVAAHLVRTVLCLLGAYASAFAHSRVFMLSTCRPAATSC